MLVRIKNVWSIKKKIKLKIYRRYSKNSSFGSFDDPLPSIVHSMIHKDRSTTISLIVHWLYRLKIYQALKYSSYFFRKKNT